MKIISSIKLGHRHIVSHKKQSLLSILSTAILFGVMFGVVFLLEGIDHTFIKNSNKISGKDIYVVSKSCSSPTNCSDYAATESLTKKKSSQYGGEIVGKVSNYKIDDKSSSYNVVDEQFVENLIQINLDEYEQGTVFRLITLDQASSLVSREEGDESPIPSEDNKQKVYSEEEIKSLKEKVLGKQFSEVYTVQNQEALIEELLDSNSSLADEIDSIFNSNSEETKSETSENQAQKDELIHEEELKYVVAGVIGSAPEPPTISRSYSDVRILDLLLSRIDNTVSIPNIFVRKNDDKSINYDTLLSFADSKKEFPITKFTKLSDAYEYYSKENCSLEQNQSTCSNYFVEELVGNRLQSKSALSYLYYSFGYNEIALLLIALSVAVFTFIRLIGENVQSIALYRSLGASSRDVFLIYFFYLAELCIMSLVLSLLIGIGLATAISIKDSPSLSALLTSLFGYPIKSGILFGIDAEFFRILVAILLAAPVCSILSLDQLSAKNIAAKLKK